MMALTSELVFRVQLGAGVIGVTIQMCHGSGQKQLPGLRLVQCKTCRGRRPAARSFRSWARSSRSPGCCQRHSCRQVAVMCLLTECLLAALLWVSSGRISWNGQALL